MHSIPRKSGLITGIALLTLVTARGISCGPFFTEATFVSHHSETKSALVSGRVGILWPGTYYSDLALIFRRLHGPAFTPAEVKQIAAVDAQRATEKKTQAIENVRYQRAPWAYTPKQRQPKGLAAWNAASQLAKAKSIPATGGPESLERSVPNSFDEVYSNCLDDAFDTAARTLRDRLRAHADDLPDVADWVKGQDAVFTNCYGAGATPFNLSAAKPLWLQKDRSYQQAAAHFYRAEWSDATDAFAAIARDQSSPWHELAQYLVARSLIRQATLGDVDDFGKFDPVVMRAAQTQLQSVTSKHGRYALSALKLLRLVDLRLDRGEALAHLGADISQPDPLLVQDLTDLFYAVTVGGIPPEAVARARKNELVDWVITMRRALDRDPAAHASARWRATHSTVWLAAALALADKPDPDLLNAAAAIPTDDPAWTTLTYHRLRLTQDESAAHDELAQLLPSIQQTESLSTINTFRILAQQKAMTPTEFMKVAALRPAGYPNGDGNDGMDEEASRLALMAGLKVNGKDSEHVDVYVAKILNEHVPVAMLAELAQQNDFPKQLQFEFAMAVWSRAVLLDKPEVATTLTPTLGAGEPRWKPYLDAYDAAQTPDDRKVTGLLAIMRFPAIRPNINAGPTREEGFGAYSYYRDNWWCANLADNSYFQATHYANYDPAQPEPPPIAPLPAFITAEMSAGAQREQTVLRKIGDAPIYFGRESLAWVKAHPDDPRSPELLGSAFRAMRNGCNLENAYNLRRQVFNTLHSRYPQSDAARKYRAFVVSDY